MVVAGLAALLAGGCCTKPAGGSNESGGTSGASPRNAPRSTEVAQQIDIATLLSDYKGNEVRADQSYKGKLVETTGIVGDVKKSIGDSMYVTIGTGRPFEIPTLQCSLASDQSGRAAALNKGDRVSIRGHVSGLMFNVQVQDCKIL